MNTEDFENQLRRTRMREVPAEWRAEVLGKVRAEGGGLRAEGRHLAETKPAGSWWRDLLWPCPQAWGALAGVWLAIVVVVGLDQHGARTQQAEAAAPPDTMITRLALERSLAGNKGAVLIL